MPASVSLSFCSFSSCWASPSWHQAVQTSCSRLDSDPVASISQEMKACGRSVVIVARVLLVQYR